MDNFECQYNVCKDCHIHCNMRQQLFELKYGLVYTSTYFDGAQVGPLGFFTRKPDVKLPLRTRFALWLFGFKKVK